MFTPIQNDRKTQGVIIARFWLQSYHSKLSTSGEYCLLSLKEMCFFLHNQQIRPYH